MKQRPGMICIDAINRHFFHVPRKVARAARGARSAPKGRRAAPPPAEKRRAAHKECFSAFIFAPIIDVDEKLTDKSVRITFLPLRGYLSSELLGYDGQ